MTFFRIFAMMASRMPRELYFNVQSMNKGYLDQMSKARMLSEGVSVHMSELVKKNIKIDIQKLNELTILSFATICTKKSLSAA